MIVPLDAIGADTLVNLIEEFVTRDGTDYGEQEVPLETRVAQVRRQLLRGEAVIWFDQTTETVSVFPRDALADLPDEVGSGRSE